MTKQEFLDHELHEDIGWLALGLGAACVFIAIKVGDPVSGGFFFASALAFALIGMRCMGSKGMTVRKIINAGLIAFPFSCALVFLFFVGNRSIPAERRLTVVQDSLKTTELAMFTELATADTLGPSRYAEMDSLAQAIDSLRIRADLIFAKIPVGTTLRVNNAAVGAYRTVVQLREEHERRLAEWQQLARSIARDRNSFVTAIPSKGAWTGLMAEQNALLAEIAAYDASDTGSVRRSARIIGFSLLAAGLLAGLVIGMRRT